MSGEEEHRSTQAGTGDEPVTPEAADHVPPMRSGDDSILLEESEGASNHRQNTGTLDQVAEPSPGELEQIKEEESKKK